MNDVIINEWEMEKEGCKTYFIREVKSDGEYFYDVCEEDGDMIDYFWDYRNAVAFVNGLWDDEEWERERPVNAPDTIESLGLQGLFGV